MENYLNLNNNIKYNWGRWKKMKKKKEKKLPSG